MALFVWLWSHHTLYICDETGLEYRGLFGHKTRRWDEAQSWNGTTLRAKDGRKIVVMLAPEGNLRASRQLAAEIEKRIAKVV